MPPVEIPFLWINPGRRAPAAYYRRGPVLRRVRDELGNPVLPGDPKFPQAFAAAARGYDAPTAPAPVGVSEGSLAALIVAYRASPEWTSRAAGTQEDYGVWLDRLRDRFGTLPVKTMPRSFVFKLRDLFATGDDGKPTPSRANKALAVLRLLLAWGVNRGWLTSNPAERPGRLQVGPGFATWRPHEFARFMAHPGISEPIKRAAALGYYTGQRKQDCIAVTKSARSGGEIEFMPAKTARRTAAKVFVPEHPELTRILDAAPATDAVTLLTRRDGRPWQVSHFNHSFVEAVRLAGLPDGHGFHGLRKALSADLASAGATDAELDAIVYHSDPGMSRLYRRDAGARELAKSAMAKLVKGKS